MRHVRVPGRSESDDPQAVPREASRASRDAIRASEKAASDGSDSDDEESTASEEGYELLPSGRAPLAAAVLAAVCCAAAVAVWRWTLPASPSESQDRSSVLSGIPGITLLPSNNALPGIPAAEPPLAGFGSALPAAAAGQAEPKVPTVVLTMLLENLDFARLQADPNARRTLTSTLQQAVATCGGDGVTEEQVSVDFEPGSVLARLSIPLEGADVAEAVQASIQSDRDRLREEVELNLRTMARFGALGDVATGVITVLSSSAPVVLGTTPAPTVTATSTGADWTSSTATTTTTSVTTITRPCGAVQTACIVNSQCCSARCLSTHRCGSRIVWT